MTITTLGNTQPDYVIDANAVGARTPTIDISTATGLTAYALEVNLASLTTAVFTLEYSPDGHTWYASGSTFTGQSRLARVDVRGERHARVRVTGAEGSARTARIIFQLDSFNH